MVPTSAATTLPVGAVHHEHRDGHHAHRPHKRRDERIAAALKRGNDRQQEHRDARREPRERGEPLEARDGEQRDEEYRWPGARARAGGRSPPPRNDAAPPSRLSLTSTRSPSLRKPFGSSARRPPHSTVTTSPAVQAAIELQLDPLEGLAHACLRGIAVPGLDHADDVGVEDRGALALVPVAARR